MIAICQECGFEWVSEVIETRVSCPECDESEFMVVIEEPKIVEDLKAELEAAGGILEMFKNMNLFQRIVFLFLGRRCLR